MPKISLVAKPAGKGSVTADAIPDSVKRDIEDLWKGYQEAPENEIRIEFNTGFVLDDLGAPTDVEDTDNPAEDPELWVRQAASYGRQRMNEKGESEALKIRALPKRNLPKHIKYITIARDIPKDAATNTHKTSR